MLLSNVNIYTPEHGFLLGDLSFDARINGVFLKGAEDASCDYCIPGLIDIHTHGNSGEDYSDGSGKGIEKMADYYAANGITGIAGTTMTLPQNILKKACETCAEFVKNRKHGALLHGIHLEGPYFSYNKRGAQNPDYLRTPDLSALKELIKASEGLVKISDVAPELDGAGSYIREASKLVRVSIAHTEANYEQTSEAIKNGARLLTHTFNAMSPISGRNPGPIVACSEHREVMAELISDGKHVAPANIRMLFRLFGEDRIVLISDSLRCAGMQPGSYELAGQKITVRDGLGYLADGTIAGAASNLYKNMLSAISFGIPKESVIKACTLNPAKVLGIYEQTGSLTAGKNADLVLTDKNFGIKNTFVMGEVQYNVNIDSTL